MSRQRVLVTGSSGLIGSEAVRYFDQQGAEVVGIDNNMRQKFFGLGGDTRWNLHYLKEFTKNFTHKDIDIRNQQDVFDVFSNHQFDLIVHCAAQPSHDKAREIPLLDFEVNALGTMHLLEATRQFCPEAVFVHMSTNKVYGDAPNEYPLIELSTRYDFAEADHYHGINENCRIDQSLHSLFGASKVSADVMVQEYGRYFKMNTGILRAGCLTGPSHAGVELHGFLSYLVKTTVSGQSYSIFGYKGKQVRDQLHSFDVIRAVEAFAAHPRPGEVYNIGGGRENSASVLECIELIEQATGTKLNWSYQENNRIGDHICYISDLRKFKQHYPEWSVAYSLQDIIQELVETEWTKQAQLLVRQKSLADD